MTEQSFADKAILFREGDEGDHAYILLSGQIEILKRAEHGEVRLALLEAGNVFGEMALLEAGAQRSATARAIGETQVESLSAAEFAHLMEQCPLSLRPFLTSLIGRLRDSNERVARKERATVLLDVAIHCVTVHGEGALQEILMPLVAEVANLPLAIGGHAPWTDPPGQNIDIACAETPPLVSPLHCQIERQGNAVYIVDKGSRFGTMVNGQAIGRGKPSFKAALVKGENQVQLGGEASPYRLRIEAS